MNHRSEIDRVLEVWMADGPAAIPDRVVDVIAIRIAVQRQRRTWPFPGRTNVTSQIKLIAGLAAALVVAVVGYNLLPRQTSIGGPTTGPTPTAQPTATATAAASSGVACPAWKADGCGDGAGILSAGTHATRSFQPGTPFTVPDGWVNDTDSADFFGLFPDTPANEAEFARSGGPAQGIFMGVVDTPALRICSEVGDTHGSTAAELVDSLVADEGLVTSDPVAVTIGDLTGTRVDAYLDPDWTASCTPGSDDPPTTEDKERRGRYVFLDMPDGGKLLMIVDSVTAADFDGFLAEAMPILESFDFDLR